jgi:uncharacterized small protein (DUF1192 family)
MTRGRAYLAIVAALVVFGSPVLSIVASVQIAERNAERIVIEREKAESAAQTAARSEARRLTCEFFATSLDVYDEAPPTTEAGKKLRQKYLELYSLPQNQCHPPRK